MRAYDNYPNVFNLKLSLCIRKHQNGPEIYRLCRINSAPFSLCSGKVSQLSIQSSWKLYFLNRLRHIIGHDTTISRFKPANNEVTLMAVICQFYFINDWYISSMVFTNNSTNHFKYHYYCFGSSGKFIKTIILSPTLFRNSSPPASFLNERCRELSLMMYIRPARYL